MPKIEFSFRGGINAKLRPEDISGDECAIGQNFDLDPKTGAHVPRPAFETVGFAPNGAAIHGLAQLIKADGTISTLVQAGGKVYVWDGTLFGFTEVGTVDPGARLRGPIAQNFTLSEQVIITDLARIENVKTWDGTSFTDLTHNLGTDFKAKYARVRNERTFYANVITGTTDTPHVILGSGLQDAGDLTNSIRPASAVGLDDPFFIPVPDLKPINGFEFGFGISAISTRRGRLYVLSGNNKFDFEMEELYFGSAVTGDEAMLNVGNDIFLGRASRIDTLSGIDRFGDVQADDPSVPIDPLIEGVQQWTIGYDRPRAKIFCFPNNLSDVYVYHKNVVGLTDEDGQPLSPWSRYRTAFPLQSGGGVTGQFGGGTGGADGTGTTIGFGATVSMPLFDPVSGSEQLFFGDGGGRLFTWSGKVDEDGEPSGLGTVSMTLGLNRSFTPGFDSVYVYGRDGDKTERKFVSE